MHSAIQAFLALALLFGTPSAHAQDASIQAVLKKYNMLGTFAINCTMPASKTNTYVVRRPLDAGRIQSDVMIGPTERSRANVIDRAAGLGPNEIAISWTSEGQGRINAVFRIEPGRHRPLEMTEESGKKLIVEGRGTEDGAGAAPWLNNCDAVSTRAVFEKHNLLGTFAVDCRKPVGRGNYYVVHRPLDAGRIQRDTMIGPNERSAGRIMDRAAELGPGEIAVSVLSEQADYVYRVEANRFRIFTAAKQYGEKFNGDKFIVDGRALLEGGGEMPWMNRCK